MTEPRPGFITQCLGPHPGHDKRTRAERSRPTVNRHGFSSLPIPSYLWGQALACPAGLRGHVTFIVWRGTPLDARYYDATNHGPPTVIKIARQHRRNHDMMRNSRLVVILWTFQACQTNHSQSLDDVVSIYIDVALSSELVPGHMAGGRPVQQSCRG